MAWISRRELNELKAELKVAERQASEAEKQTAYAEAKLDGLEDYVVKLEESIRILNGEKKELLDDLLIASGVKMSKYQEALAQKQMDESDQRPGYTGQTRAWSHEMTQESLGMSKEERNRRAIEMVEELEREGFKGIDFGGNGNV